MKRIYENVFFLLFRFGKKYSFKGFIQHLKMSFAIKKFYKYLEMIQNVTVMHGSDCSECSDILSSRSMLPNL